MTIELLRLLAKAGGVREMYFVEQAAGIALHIETRDDEGTLKTALDGVLIFAAPETAGRTVRELALGRAVLGLAHWRPRKIYCQQSFLKGFADAFDYLPVSPLAYVFYDRPTHRWRYLFDSAINRDWLDSGNDLGCICIESIQDR